MLLAEEGLARQALHLTPEGCIGRGRMVLALSLLCTLHEISLCAYLVVLELESKQVDNSIPLELRDQMQVGTVAWLHLSSIQHHVQHAVGIQVKVADQGLHGQSKQHQCCTLLVDGDCIC